MDLKLLRPKDATRKSIEVALSERTLKLLQLYSDYCQQSTDDIIEHYLQEVFKLDTGCY